MALPISEAANNAVIRPIMGRGDWTIAGFRRIWYVAGSSMSWRFCIGVFKPTSDEAIMISLAPMLMACRHRQLHPFQSPDRYSFITFRARRC